MTANIRVRALAVLTSVWKGVVGVVVFVDAHYWLGRVCHVGELDVVFAFVQVLHE
jgi:hypothetical protein